MGPNKKSIQKKTNKKVKPKKVAKGVARLSTHKNNKVKGKRETPNERSDRAERANKILKVTESKKIWEKLRLRKLDPKERQNQIEKILNLWKDNLKKACLRPDTCRVIQSVVKYGSDQQKSFLVRGLVKDVIELSKDRYGHFIVLKLFRYCSNEQIGEILDSFRGQLVSLLKNRFSSDVVDFFFQAVANAKQKKILMRELYCANERQILTSMGDSLKDVFSLKSFLVKIGREFHETIFSSIISLLDSFSNNAKLMQCALVHHLAKECFEEVNGNTRKVLASSLISHGSVMLHTREGSQVVIECIKLADAKEKKQLSKSLKADIVKVGVNECGHKVLLSLIHFTDDTAMLESVIFREIIRNAKNLLTDKYGRLPILHLLCPSSRRYFNPLAYSFLSDDLNGTEVKKDFETRRQELLNLIRYPLEDALQKNLLSFVCNSFAYVVVLEYVLYIFRKGENISNWLEAIENIYCLQLENKMQENSSTVKSDSLTVETRFPARILRILCKTLNTSEVYQHILERIGKYKDIVQDVEERRLASTIDSFNELS
ncbi:Pumilio domain-containing protein KIAA0020 [Galdieria sulphuraria]|uniref:RNA-binding protein n=1 Tax=Galdieria sulphuraria TaxID=130081 RepID=M2XI77_GALSU|nr:RNA-binding protein [Galdieria sulphuraria]EME29792.1 RNA-binding protein [Galdieria sulphuraria]GJD06780.1 Pumilio domain-containing protein KIAA0020 [Galdieria sulphuraria]|eukprot:XP_005706312.1 RNA-binding protein [Galdieria sulphuraria]